MQRIIREYQPADLDDVLASWESATRLAHPFLQEDFLEQERHKPIRSDVNFMIAMVFSHCQNRHMSRRETDYSDFNLIPQ